ncbi:LOW QUALITY PROTEIN: hypothetical protein HID58_022473 [Brassica napus]|uniref:Uncharacterized protein n=1 Tax=Brassica napus TaxID=3708 RepID=A0ABQ8CZC5_BRANA|nr:LOW QUALITY PROTEIN: hypothetical protein HID58_022473 [Brassica napus]
MSILVERNFDLPATIDRRDSGGSPSLQDFGHHAGYYKLPNSKAARMFYFFFESRSNKADPVVIWLTGGPGCSSELALFYENGPFTVSNNSSLAWTISLGQGIKSNLRGPTGTGFSYTSDESDLRHDEDGAFFKEHPQFVKNDFTLLVNPTPDITFRHWLQEFTGFAIGNGLTNPEIQYAAYADYALDMKLISQSDHDNLNRDYETCQQSIKECSADGGNNVRKLCYDFSNMEKFLNQKSVRTALGVGDIEFVSCTGLDANLEVGIPALLEDGIKMLIYAGEYDLICNWLGNSKWVHEMEWSGRKEFVAAATVPFNVDNREAGLMKNHGSLTFLKVHDAGHGSNGSAKSALQMLKDWMQGKLGTPTGRTARQ